MEKHTEVGSVIIGAATSITIGNFVFEILGTLVLGVVGALGGYLFNKLIKPKFDDYFKKKLNKHVDK